MIIPVGIETLSQKAHRFRQSLGIGSRPSFMEQEWLFRILEPEQQVELVTRLAVKMQLGKVGLKGGMKRFVEVVFEFVFPTLGLDIAG